MLKVIKLINGRYFGWGPIKGCSTSYPGFSCCEPAPAGSVPYELHILKSGHKKACKFSVCRLLVCYSNSKLYDGIQKPTVPIASAKTVAIYETIHFRSLIKIWAFSSSFSSSVSCKPDTQMV